MTLVFLFEVFLERRTSLRRAVGWAVRAFALTVGVAAAALAKTVIGAEALTQRLESTETPKVIALGFLLGGELAGPGLLGGLPALRSGPVRPSASPYMTSGWVVLFTLCQPQSGSEPCGGVGIVGRPCSSPGSAWSVCS